MIVLAVVQKKSGKPAILVDWSRTFFFEEPGPEPDTLITLDLPGLKKFKAGHLSEWLTLRNREQGAAAAEPALSRRREIQRIPRDVWRPAVLDDFLEAQEWNWMLYQALEQYTLAEFQDFARRHLPEAERRIEAVLAAADGPERLAELKRQQDFVARVHGIALRCPERMQWEYNQTLERLEKARWKAAQAASDDPREWLAAAAALKNEKLLEKAALALARAARKLAATDRVAAVECVRGISKAKRLRGVTAWNEAFWELVGPLVDLPPPVTGQTIDITDARPVTVTMGWDFLKAARVGPVQPGRSALAVTDKKGRVTHYVHAERRLKFRLAKTGSLEKHGCTLTMRQDTTKSLAPALLEVERLDTVANVNPELALESIADLNLPPDHLVYRTAAAAREEPRQRRALAALLIELRFGIDADVARHLSRQQTGRG